MRNHGVALWVTSDAPGALVDEVSDEEIRGVLDGTLKWAYGDVVLGAVIAAMYRCRVPSAYAASVQVYGEGTPQWRYRIELLRAPSEVSKQRGMTVEQALQVALRQRCQVNDCYEQCVRPCVHVYQASARITMHINAASVAALDEGTLIRLLTDPVTDDDRVAGYRFRW